MSPSFTFLFVCLSFISSMKWKTTFPKGIRKISNVEIPSWVTETIQRLQFKKNRKMCHKMSHFGKGVGQTVFIHFQPLCSCFRKGNCIRYCLVISYRSVYWDSLNQYVLLTCHQFKKPEYFLKMKIGYITSKMECCHGKKIRFAIWPFWNVLAEKKWFGH